MTRLQLIRQRHGQSYLAHFHCSLVHPQILDKGTTSRPLYSTHVSRPATSSLLFCSRPFPNAAISSARLHSSLSIPDQLPSAKVFRQQTHRRCVAITTVSLRSTASITSPTSFDIRGSSFVRSLSNVFVTPQQTCTRAKKLRTSPNRTQGSFTTTAPLIATRPYHNARHFSYQGHSSPFSTGTQKNTTGNFYGGRATLSTMPHTTDESAAPAVKLLTEVLDKPSLDNRSYRVIELGNGLEALLVHDSETDKASASLDVGVGNFSDDNDMPGTAHAVEHVSDAASGCPFRYSSHSNRPV